MDIKVSLPTLAIETIASEESVTSAYEWTWEVGASCIHMTRISQAFVDI
jgi:hypothetical protein